MADPLSIAASIAGILTLGVQVSTGLAQIISDAKAADSLLTEITNDLLMLCEILRKIEALTGKWRESAADPLLPNLLERCRGSLNQLESIIATVKESFARGGLQRKWLQVTWASKQKEIATISGKISDYKSTLTLTLQMQNASDVGDLKNAINTFLAARNEPHGVIGRQTETMERFLHSAATSLYSVDRAPSYASSSIGGTIGSSIRSCIESIRSTAPARHGSLKVKASTFDDATLCGTENSTAGTSTVGSSSTLVETDLEYIQIPPSLLDPDIKDPDQFWAKLAPELGLVSPAPYSTFQELYQRIYPYLWLHGRVWHGDRAKYGTLLVTKYSPQTGKIEFSRIKSGRVPLADGAPRATLDQAFLGLRIEPPAGHEHDTTNSYSFHRVRRESGDGQPSDSDESLWPPILFPAKDRTSRSHAASRHHGRNGEKITYSLSLFELRKISTSVSGLMNGPRVELFSALDANLYTPDLEHPLRGIWCFEYITNFEFILFHQQSRDKLTGLKLTGDFFVPRGHTTFRFDDILAERLGVEIMSGLGPFFQWSDGGTLTWEDSNRVTLGLYGGRRAYDRLEIEQFI